MSQNMDESQSIMLSEKGYAEKNKEQIIPFIQHSGKVKTLGENQRNSCRDQRWKESTDQKEQQATFSGDGNILYLSCGGDYTGVYFCQNSQIYTLITKSKFYLNKMDFYKNSMYCNLKIKNT